MKRLPLLVLCGVSLLWGSGWVVSSLLAEVAEPFAAAALTFAVAICVLLWGARGHGSPRAQLSFRENLLFGLFFLACPAALLIVAGRHGAGGWTPLSYSLLPLLVAGERWSPAMAVAPGAVLLLLNGTVSFAPRTLLWAVPVLAAVAMQAWALRRLSVRLRGSRITRALGFQCAVAAALLAGCSLVFDATPAFAPLAQWGAGALAATVLVGFLGTALPYAGLYFLLEREGILPEQVAVTEWLQTLIAVGESAAMTRARPPWTMLGAAVLLLGCSVAVLRSHGVDTPVTLRAPEEA